MPHVHFESLGASLQRLPAVLQSIPDIIRNPAANPLAAAILLSIVLVLVLVILLTVVLAIMRPSYEISDEEAYEEQQRAEEATGEEAVGEAGLAAEGVAEEPAEREPVAKRSLGARFMTWVTVTAIILIIFAAVWVVAGITTGGNEVCASCHSDTVHTESAIRDPHKDVRCIQCHESGGPITRSTVDVVGRVEHFVLAQRDSKLAKAYGLPVASDGCQSCHARQVDTTLTDNARGVRVSHKEPSAAGAQCVDCHRLTNGVVSATNVGMTTCLRCHDGKIAKSECSACHLGDPARGVSSAVATEMAGVQVPNPQCNGCHKDMTKCNACHGISMPHSAKFKAYAHARAAALDIWYNDGKLCSKCHYTGHNDCIRYGCHVYPLASGHPNPAWASLHQNTGWSSGWKTACSCHMWNPYDHNGMVYCQICHTVKPKNALP